MHGRANKALQTLRPLLYGCLTGIVCGAVVALFLTCARVAVSFAGGIYSGEYGALGVVCIIMLALLCCLIMAILQMLCPSSKGSGIPLAEGYARGILRVKWFRSAAALIAGSLLSFTCGMPLGSEGPSIGVGGLIGDGIGKAAKKPLEFRRYLITGGSGAGLAVAFNAPLTGVALAVEETHRRFSPGILLAAFSAVVPAIITAQLIFWGLGQNAYLNSLGVRAGTSVLPYLAQKNYANTAAFFGVCGIAAVCGVACALVASAFNHAIFALGKLFGKIKYDALRLLPAFALTVICGLTLPYVIGSGELTLEHIDVDTGAWLLLGLLALRLAMTTITGGSGATGGLFLPMIALGGITGTLAAKAGIACGMDPGYAPNVIMLCISAFFAASVRAPISAIAMAVELTASFANLLPCAIAVAIATALGGLTKADPLYEHMMEELQRRAPVPDGSADTAVTGTVFECSEICGKRIRDILWPYNSLVTELKRRDGTDVVPDGETVIAEGDIIHIRAENVVPSELKEQLRTYIRIE